MPKSVCWANMFQKNTKRRDRKIIMGEFFGKFINFETTLKPTDT